MAVHGQAQHKNSDYSFKILTQSLLAAESSKTAYTSDYRKLEHDIRNFHSSFPDEPEAPDQIISNIKETIRDAETDIKRLEEQRESRLQKVTDLEKEAMELKLKAKMVDEDFQAYQRKLDEALKQVAKKESKLVKLRSKRENLAGDIERLKRELAAAEEELVKLARTEERFLDHLNQIGVTPILEKIEESADVLEKEWERAKKKQVETEARLAAADGTRYNVLVQRRNELSVQHEQLAKDFRYLCKMRANLGKIMDKHDENLKFVEKYSTERLKAMFKKTLDSRGFEGEVELGFNAFLYFLHISGSIEVSHERKEINIVVIPAHRQTASADDNRVTGTVGSLSGGEKSFSMVCLIVSLWIATDMPIHMIDEFDVFMDNVNRTFALKMLVSMARRFNTQFVFLSPLDMPTDVLEKGEEPFRMPDPERARVE